MSFVNLYDSKFTLFKNKRVGHSYEVDEMQQTNNNDPHSHFELNK